MSNRISIQTRDQDVGWLDLSAAACWEGGAQERPAMFCREVRP